MTYNIGGDIGMATDDVSRFSNAKRKGVVVVATPLLIEMKES